jgi:type IV pilus assembly protein PilV
VKRRPPRCPLDRPGRRAAPRPAARGFSLVEVLVSLVVVSVGLLGLAKMESLAIASTGVASSRSLAAILASSLADAMHANRSYWATAGTPPASFTVSGSGVGNITDSTNTLNVAVNCATGVTPSCSAAQVAAYDVQQWQLSLQPVLTGYLATVSCSTLTTTPVNCNIQLQWVERAAQAQTQYGNTAAQNTAASAALATVQYTDPYILDVQP